MSANDGSNGTKIASIRHFNNCRADYPEKLAGEAARHIVTLDIGDGEYVRQCVDCGAYTLDAAADIRAAQRLRPAEFAQLVAPSPEERLLMAYAGAMDILMGLGGINDSVERVERNSK